MAVTAIQSYTDRTGPREQPSNKYYIRPSVNSIKGMLQVDPAVGTARRHVIGPLVQQWLALEADYKSIACAVAVLGAVVGLDLRIPW